MFSPLRGSEFDKRAVLVPIFRALGSKVIIAQPRGYDFSTHCEASKGIYEVDTMERDGTVSTMQVEIEATGSLSLPGYLEAFLDLPKELPNLRYIGIGVTESGIRTQSLVMLQLLQLLYECYLARPENDLSVIDTDNTPKNGDSIRRCVESITSSTRTIHIRHKDLSDAEMSSFQAFLASKVHWHNTVVDRITYHRQNDKLVPLAEPIPKKVLIIEDLDGVLKAEEWTSMAPEVCIRHKAGELARDQALKLNVANATHTAMVYLLVLSRVANTREASQVAEWETYMDRLFHSDLLPALEAIDISSNDAVEVYREWIDRIKHPHFGLGTFWVAQNAVYKFEERLFSVIKRNMERSKSYRPSVYISFALAVMLRFLTPVEMAEDQAGLYIGQMDVSTTRATVDTDTQTCAAAFRADFISGFYEFKDYTADETTEKLLYNIGQTALKGGRNATSEQVASTGTHITAILSNFDGFDLQSSRFVDFAASVTILYQRMLTSTSLEVLGGILSSQDDSEYLSSPEQIENYVKQSVDTVDVIDVHTHLFPPSHGNLMLWGIDELLTYHYLIAEYIMTSSMEIEDFNKLPKREQAQLIWNHLFIERSPISEACRGVITALQALGLDELVARRDFKEIQKWYDQQNPFEHVQNVFRLSRIKYAIMTNIPFDPEEARHWLGNSSSSYRRYFRSALRVDQMLLGDWQSIIRALDVFQYSHSLDGCRALLSKWIETMRPEYFMASAPIHFQYFSRASMTVAAPAQPPSGSDLLHHVLLPLAEAKRLPIALKFDSVRPINARLGVAGDGVEPCDVNILIQLCRDYPNVKFLATFLSRVNQHQVTVAANKFRNLHLYGCWWYCNNPSIIEEMTRMRLEILGTAFTAQHSDARVLDQLLYKWKHSREIIGPILVEKYQDLLRSGWKLTKAQVDRDISRLFGSAYEEFMAK